jgi:phosphoglycolate phosphatase
MHSHGESSLSVRYFRAFVFDLDGTLVDSRPAIEKAAQIAIARVAPAFSGRSITAAIGPPIRQMFETALGHVDPGMLDSLVAAFRDAYDSDVCRETPAYPGAAQLLSSIAARGATSFVLTNKPHVPTRLILSALGLESHVGEIVTPDSPSHPFVSKAKALGELIERRGLARASTVFAGDSMDDAAAAEACGVAFAAAIYGYGNLESRIRAENWLTIETPADMLRFLGK